MFGVPDLQFNCTILTKLTRNVMIYNHTMCLPSVLNNQIRSIGEHSSLAKANESKIDKKVELVFEAETSWNICFTCYGHSFKIIVPFMIWRWYYISQVCNFWEMNILGTNVAAHALSCLLVVNYLTILHIRSL